MKDTHEKDRSTFSILGNICRLLISGVMSAHAEFTWMSLNVFSGADVSSRRQFQSDSSQTRCNFAERYSVLNCFITASIETLSSPKVDRVGRISVVSTFVTRRVSSWVTVSNFEVFELWLIWSYDLSYLIMFSIAWPMLGQLMYLRHWW